MRAAPVAASTCQRRDPPVVVAIAFRGGGDEALAVGRPAVFVDISVGRRHQLQRAALRGQHRDALFVVLLADLAHLGGARLDRAGHLVRAQRDQQRDAVPSGEKRSVLAMPSITSAAGAPARCAGIQRGLVGLVVGGQEHQRARRRTPARISAAGAGIVAASTLPSAPRTTTLPCGSSARPPGSSLSTVAVRGPIGRQRQVGELVHRVGRRAGNRQQQSQNDARMIVTQFPHGIFSLSGCKSADPTLILGVMAHNNGMVPQAAQKPRAAKGVSRQCRQVPGGGRQDAPGGRNRRARRRHRPGLCHRADQRVRAPPPGDAGQVGRRQEVQAGQRIHPRRRPAHRHPRTGGGRQRPRARPGAAGRHRLAARPSPWPRSSRRPSAPP